MISVTRLFETTFRELINMNFSDDAGRKIRPLSITEMIDFASKTGLLDTYEIKNIREALKIRNRLLHEGGSISSSHAERLVRGILQTVSELRTKLHPIK